jgi:transposase
MNKLDKIRLPEGKDRRVKLTLAQREKIKEEYEQGGVSQRQLAKMYGVSRRLITFYINPERHAVQKALYKERRKDGRYYDREKHTKAIASLRNYKRKLIK